MSNLLKIDDQWYEMHSVEQCVPGNTYLSRCAVDTFVAGSNDVRHTRVRLTPIDPPREYTLGKSVLAFVPEPEPTPNTDAVQRIKRTRIQHERT